MKRCGSGAAGGTAGRPGESAPAQPGGLLALSCGMATGKVIITFTGELDLASAEQAFAYVRDIIDRHHALVVLDLAPLSFCDAQGLGTLVRISKYAGKAGCALRLISPRPQLLKIMRITNLDSELKVQPNDPAGQVAC
jgi:anti-sigma B factor antagonist